MRGALILELRMRFGDIKLRMKLDTVLKMQAYAKCTTQKFGKVTASGFREAGATIRWVMVAGRAKLEPPSVVSLGSSGSFELSGAAPRDCSVWGTANTLLVSEVRADSRIRCAGFALG